MSYSHKLHNPTPFKVEIEWDRGVVIVISPDSSTELSTKQMEQFAPGEPGHEEIRKMMDGHGVFLEDSDRQYDAQALKALKACAQFKEMRYNESVSRLQDMHTMQGIDANELSEAFQKKLRSMGLARLKNEILMLEKRIKQYAQVVGEDEDVVSRGHVFDPDRTCFILDPPREFKSVTALNVFLSETDEVTRQAHELDVRNRAVEVAKAQDEELYGEQSV